MNDNKMLISVNVIKKEDMVHWEKLCRKNFAWNNGQLYSLEVIIQNYLTGELTGQKKGVY